MPLGSTTMCFFPAHALPQATEAASHLPLQPSASPSNHLSTAGTTELVWKRAAHWLGALPLAFLESGFVATHGATLHGPAGLSTAPSAPLVLCAPLWRAGLADLWDHKVRGVGYHSIREHVSAARMGAHAWTRMATASATCSNSP